MTELLTGLPTSLKVFSIFITILLLYKLRIPLGLAVFSGALLLSLWSATGLNGLNKLFHSIIEPENVLLYLVILFLLFFTEALTASGRMSRTVEALRKRISNPKIILAGLPALIGLLPMPGGALFSAPLVESADTDSRLSPRLKIAINYWFRHIWEYWWPLYPGVILAIRYTKIPVGMYIGIMSPLTIAAIAGGYFFILRHVPTESIKSDGRKIDPSALLATLVPIVLLVGSAVGGSIVLPEMGMDKSISNLVSMLAGLVLSLCVIFIVSPAAIMPSVTALISKKTALLLIVIVGVQSFAAVLKLPLDTESMTIVSVMRDELVGFGIPVVLVVVLLPFISGAVTGIAVGFVGASFPLVIALLGPQPTERTLVITAVLAFTFGYAGMLLSPVHICFVVTSEYFKTSLYRTYSLLAGPLLTILAGAFAVAGCCYLLL